MAMMRNEDRAWIRARLAAWGIWVNMAETLPPRARLRTGGGDYVGDERDNEDTNHAVIVLRKYYPGQAALLNYLYVPDADGRTASMREVLEHPGKCSRVGCSHKARLYEMRDAAERNVSFFLMGRRTDRGDMALPAVVGG